MRRALRIPDIVQPARNLVREVLGQVRPVTLSGQCLLVALRKGVGEVPDILDTVEQRLVALPDVAGAWFVPELDRLVVLAHPDQDPAVLQPAVTATIQAVEDEFVMGSRRFSTRSRLPDLEAGLPRIYLEMGMDLAGFTTGLMMRRVSHRSFYFFTKLAAVDQVVQQTPQLRERLDVTLGQANTDLLLQAVATLSESFSHGWSGSLVDLGQRCLQWQSEKARSRCWQGLSGDVLAAVGRLPRGLRPPPDRPRPVPPGEYENYRATAEKLSLAAFSAGMAFSHDLNRSTATLFSSTPRPATYGRTAFRLGWSRALAEQGVLVLAPEVLDYLDRVDRIVVEAPVVAATRLVATARYPGASEPLDPDALDEVLEPTGTGPGGGRGSLRAVQPRRQDRLPEGVRDWWQDSGEPLSALRLIREGRRVRDAVLVRKATDHTVESLLSRARSAGHKVSIFKSRDANAGRKIRGYQARGETVLALASADWLRFADVSVALVDPVVRWPAGAHLVTRQPLDTLWRMLSGIQQARAATSQSIQLAKIDACSGLVLALEPINRQLMGRIRLAANLASFAALANGYRLAGKAGGLPPELRDDPTPWHVMEADLVLERLGHERQRQPEPPSAEPAPSLPALWLQELRNPLVPVLLAGTGLAALTGAVGDAVMISSVVGVNALVGSLQRRRTERQLQSLGMTADTEVTVERDGHRLALTPQAIRPGDRLMLSTGDLIPADARLLRAEALEVDEASLTGESVPVAKSPEPSHSVHLGERHSMLYEGTTIVRGQAEAVVVAAKARSESQRAGYVTSNRSTGVEARLDRLAQITAPVAGIAGVALLLNGLARNRPVREVVSSGVSLAVAAVPEGLPILATLSQLAAAGRLSEHRALARNPRAVEALGRMTVLCADKTGTLTEGRLALHHITVADELQSADAMDERAGDVLLISALASPETHTNEEPMVHATDQALREAVLEHEADITRAASSWRRIEEMPFKSGQVYHATLVQRNGRRRICVKGAPDDILHRCNRWQRPDGQVVKMAERTRSALEQQSHELASQGLRILAVAERPARSATLNEGKVERLVFRGFVALADPIRRSARESVDQLRAAGIRVTMMTGDHPETAAAIGRQLGLDGNRGVLTGDRIDELSDQALAREVQDVSIFARVTPAQKGRLVTALQDAGEVVGMTGDGANDAAAIRLAEVGIALGRDSSQSAQEAADLLVLDPHIETIVHAVQEGRALWSSVRDSVSLLVGGNLGEIGFNLVAGLLSGGSPLNARQLLLINLLTDTFPALAVALRKPQSAERGRLLAEGPDSALGEALTREIQWRAGLTTSVASASWGVSRWLLGPERAATVGMLTVIGSQLAQTVVAGEASRNVLVTSAASMGSLALVVQTPGLSRVFGCARPGLVGWTLVGGALGVSLVGSRFLGRVEQGSERLEKRLAQQARHWLTRDD